MSIKVNATLTSKWKTNRGSLAIGFKLNFCGLGVKYCTAYVDAASCDVVLPKIIQAGPNELDAIGNAVLAKIAALGKDGLAALPTRTFTKKGEEGTKSATEMAEEVVG